MSIKFLTLTSFHNLNLNLLLSPSFLSPAVDDVETTTLDVVLMTKLELLKKSEAANLSLVDANEGFDEDDFPAGSTMLLVGGGAKNLGGAPSKELAAAAEDAAEARAARVVLVTEANPATDTAAVAAVRSCGVPFAVVSLPSRPLDDSAETDGEWGDLPVQASASASASSLPRDAAISARQAGAALVALLDVLSTKPKESVELALWARKEVPLIPTRAAVAAAVPLSTVSSGADSEEGEPLFSRRLNVASEASTSSPAPPPLALPKLSIPNFGEVLKKREEEEKARASSSRTPSTPSTPSAPPPPPFVAAFSGLFGGSVEMDDDEDSSAEDEEEELSNPLASFFAGINQKREEAAAAAKAKKAAALAAAKASKPAPKPAPKPVAKSVAKAKPVRPSPPPPRVKSREPPPPRVRRGTATTSVAAAASAAKAEPAPGLFDGLFGGSSKSFADDGTQKKKAARPPPAAPRVKARAAAAPPPPPPKRVEPAPKREGGSRNTSSSSSAAPDKKPSFFGGLFSQDTAFIDEI